MQGVCFGDLKSGYKHNCIETSSHEEYWISGCKKDETDAYIHHRLHQYMRMYEKNTGRP